MANPRALDKRRKSIKNIRKITRTMELIATARFKKAMDRASAATAYTHRITQLVTDLTPSGPRGAAIRCSRSARRCNKRDAAGADRQPRLVRRLQRQRRPRGRRMRWERAARPKCPNCRLEVAGKRGIAAFKFRGLPVDQSLHPLRGQAGVRRSRRDRQPLPRRVRDRQARSARRRLHASSSASPGSRSRSRRCCRWARSARPTRRSEDRRAAPTCDVRVPAVAREHSGRGRADELQGEALQVLPRLGGERADRPHGGDEERHRKRRRSDQAI